MPARFLLALSVLLAVPACKEEPLVPATASLRFELVVPQAEPSVPPVLTLPTIWAGGAPSTAQVRLVNIGTRELEVSYRGLQAPFEGDFPSRVPPGASLVTVRYAATDAGTDATQVVASAPDVAPAALVLAARSRAIPSCPPLDVCHQAHFDLEQGQCVQEVLPEGTQCDPGTRCVTGATCRGGRCLGPRVTCDDGNACTVDVCYPESGCENLPAPPCPGDGVCSVGVCNPATGCELAPAQEGIRCGPTQTCTAAQVCVGGACVVREPPEGYVCEEASPCNDQGRCQAQVCVHQQPPWTLQPRWSFDSLSPAPDAGALQYHDFVLEPSGALTLGGFFSSPGVLRANVSPVLAPQGGARRCILWNGRLVCADYPAVPNGRVSALDLATGQLLWSYDGRAAHPDFMAVVTQLFLARLVVQSPDRLAALYESYPADTHDAGTASAYCRSYFLIILDARGREVSGRPLHDPLLDVCNHPHPYGVAADSVGNLSIAFSPTISAQAPLLPAAPTLLMSFTRDGLFRWKKLLPGMPGGELAVARGLLYPENSPEVLSAATGELAFTLPSPAGRIVVADARHLPAPVAGGTSLTAYEAGEATQRWVHSVPDGYHFFGDQLRLATWATTSGPRTVALTFLQDGLGLDTRLHAVDVQNGLQAFSCQAVLPPRTAPQLFEVADGHLAVMGGALDPSGDPVCEKCDPPMAYSSAAFEVVEVPGVSRAQEPWPGTFGGPSHDHQEKVRTVGGASDAGL